MKTLRCTILLVIPLVAALQGAAQPTATPTPPPEINEDVLKIKTNLVQVDVVVIDERGQQVKGLTAADFKIVDNGKQHAPEFVSYISLARATSNPVVSGHPSAEQLGRVFVFVVSNPVIHFAYSLPGSGTVGPRTGTFNNSPTASRAADSVQTLLSWFVDKQLANVDLAAIASTDIDLGVLSSFTNDRVVLGAALKGIQDAVTRPAVKVTLVGPELSLQQLADLNLRVMDTLENVINQVEMLPGRKVVTLLAGGLLYNPRLPYFQAISERLDKLIKRANKARISIYTVQTRDLDYNRRGGNDGLIHLAQQTGGRPIYNTNDLRVEFDKVIEENRGYYLLAYNPGADLEQRPANLQVSVNRSHVKVLSRAEGLVQKAVTAKSQLEHNPFASPLSSNEIGLSISPAISATKRGQVETSLRVDLSKAAVHAREDGRQSFSLGLSIRVAGPDGLDFKRADRDLSFDVSEAELETVKRDGVLSTFSFEGEKPGFYRISVAVRDNYSGKLGNSRVFVEVSKKELSKKPS